MAEKGLHPANLLYAHDGLALFWVSGPNTRHSREIEAGPRVAVTIAADNSDFSVIRGLQLAGTAACIVTEDRRAGVLSGGQGKMVALGRALVAGTRFVLLDEPFQGLAPALAIAYADALVRLRRSRPELGLLITESTPKLLDKIVDSALTIERGEVS